MGLDPKRQRSVLLLKPFFITEVEVLREFEKSSGYGAKPYRFAEGERDFAVFYSDSPLEDVIRYRSEGRRMMVVVNSDSDYSNFGKALRTRGLEIEDLFDGVVVLEVNTPSRDIRETFRNLIELEQNYMGLGVEEKAFLRTVKLLIDWGVHTEGFRIPRKWLKRAYEVKGLVDYEGEYIKVHPDKVGYLVKTEKNRDELVEVYGLVRDMFEPLYRLAYNLFVVILYREHSLGGVEDVREIVEEIFGTLLRLSKRPSERARVLSLKALLLSTVERDYIAALDHMERALKLARESGDRALLGRVLFDLGRVYFNLDYFYGTRDNLDRAYESIWEGYLILGESINPEFYNFMVRYFTEKGDVERFLKWAYISMEKMKNFAKVRGYLTNQVILALLRFNDRIPPRDRHRLKGFVLGTINNTLNALYKVLKIQILVNFAFYLGTCEGRYKQALGFLERALKIADAEDLRVFVMIDRGYIYSLMGDYARAYENLKFSYEYCIRNISAIPKKEFEFVAKHYLRVLRGLGMEEEVENVERQLRQYFPTFKAD